jgi:hypothetical protein
MRVLALQRVGVTTRNALPVPAIGEWVAGLIRNLRKAVER